MSQSKQVFEVTREAARDLSDYQYHAMKIDTSNQIDYVDTSSAGAGIGILQNKPEAEGQEAEVRVLGTSLMYVDGNSINIGVEDMLGSNSNYHGVKVDADKDQYFAIALEASSADGDLIEVLLLGGPHYISAT
ncbi:MAG: hypothetical protein WC322_02280 [Candidatus Paceibacterota bacterium]|jgi:hypothetical protein